MSKVKYIYRAWAILLVLFVANVAIAQQKSTPNSPASIEYLKARSLWFYSGNGAGLVLDKLNNFSFLEATYSSLSGDFKRVQQGDKESTLSVVTEGGQKLGKAYAWGQFSYNNETVRDSRFNTAMLDPFRGVPYYPVDPNISDWKKQNYNLQMSVASKPLWDRYILGIQAKYNAYTGAKQVDPRSEQYIYSINIKPGIAASWGNHQVGVNVEYENMIQETRKHTNSNSQVDQNVYVMKGLGHNYTSVIGGLQSLGSFLYNANKVGAEIQYSYSLCDIKFLVNGGYYMRAEDVIRDITKPRKEGSLIENGAYAKLSALLENENLHRVDLSYKRENLKGIEYVQVLDTRYEVQQWVDLYSSVRSTYNYDQIGLSYDFYRGSDNEYKWKGGLFTDYRLNFDRYHMPASRMLIENLFLGIDGKVNLPVALNSRFLLGGEFVYKYNVNGFYKYGGPEPTDDVITKFMEPDFNYLKESYYKIGANLSFYTVVGKSQKNGLFFRASGDYYKPKTLSGSRVFATFGVGLTF